ncbi:TPA: GntR family transcriptional regulator [Streptococcus suis]|uniref:GntR family transcriptional regulator n=1 Tax=Streptococcus TaxID=1301 RepID=UPI000CF44C40|nr:GntR family transcriptional regulator [Streptococcus suis]MCK4044592.1 GntR family transcriptional regulator [Streptococcus suis]MCQ8262377.1 GntR family transcriptional regulator [Streptococcus suis]MDG4506303.1 GntR family transcriptional regulator [Streptococcus suis]NQI33271.1 GntR family transcriptional regulator [Streptococcus suis]NQJ19255.1 GntR family transcriptional regulator [Streptococcus suis]
MEKYNVIANDVRRKILDGIYKANDQLPFEKDLCEVYEVSKMTVKKALDILVAEGLIIKRRGAGTFVKDLSVEDMEKMVVGSQMIGTSAYYPTRTVTSKVLHFEIIAASEKVANKLNIPIGSFVYDIERVRILDGSPLVMENTFMPVSVIPDLRLKNVEESIYEYIQDTLGMKIQSAHRNITVRKASDSEVTHLELEQGDPVGIVEQIGFLSNGTTFEYSISTHRYDTFSIEMMIRQD